MIDETIKQYLEKLVPNRDEIIIEIERYAKMHQVPIMDLLSMETMLQILRLCQPKKILEIGTAIGYSAIRMAKALPNTTIYTIERDEDRYKEAVKNVEECGLTNRIHIIFGDALEEVQQLEKEGHFDVLFIDAAKGQYRRFFELYTPYLIDNGIVISDNVLFRGYVAEEMLHNKRLKNLAKKIDQYNQWLTSHPDYLTTILPIGDGIAISVKKNK